jgi:uncharacterized protein YndB with AHSA1/START domain
MEQSYSTTLLIAKTPEQVFTAVNDPRAWWSKSIVGVTDQVDAVFNYHFRDVHRCTVRVKELVPGKKVVWTVLENAFSFTEDLSEWTGTEIAFEITARGDKTELRFTHHGLTPAYECYDVCSEGWHTYVGSLAALLTTGKGRPNEGEPMTASEQAAVEGAL